MLQDMSPPVIKAKTPVKPSFGASSQPAVDPNHLAMLADRQFPSISRDSSMVAASPVPAAFIKKR